MFEDHTVAVFEKRQDAENALKTLENDGISMDKLSIVGTEPFTEEHALRYLAPGEKVLALAGWAALWGACFGLIFGPLFLRGPAYVPLGNVPYLPGGGFAISPWVLFWGPFINACVFASIAAVVGLSCGLNNRRRSAVKYETRVGHRRYFLVIQGAGEDLVRVRSLLVSRMGALATASSSTSISSP